MYCHPGKKLLFMGGEFAQRQEWNHDRSLDWHLLEHPPHAGVQTLVRDLNALYRQHAGPVRDRFRREGFEWIDWDDRDNSVFSWMRRDASDGDFVVVRRKFHAGRPG